MRTLSAFSLAALGLGLLVGCSSSGSGSGTPAPTSLALDGTFGTNGIATTAIGTIGDEINAIRIQADGKVVAAGLSAISAGVNRFAVARYNSDGSLDTTFGTGGFVTTAIGTGDAEAQAVALQPDGKVLAGGFYTINGGWQWAVVRYNADGSLDTGYGTGGIVTTPLAGTENNVFGMEVQADGKLLAAGSHGMPYQVALMRYNTDGSLDPTFGTGGVMTRDVGAQGSVAWAMVLQGDGKPVTTGACADASGTFQFGVARFDTAGALDPTFGNGGVATKGIGSMFDMSVALALQADGKLVAGGFSATSFTDDFHTFPAHMALARFNADGTLDTGFGASGTVSLTLDAPWNRVSGLTTQADGKLVAAGSTGATRPTAHSVLMRFTAAGALDPTFGNGGIGKPSLSTESDKLFCVAVQADGKLVSGGYAQVSGVRKFALIRVAAP